MEPKKLIKLLIGIIIIMALVMLYLFVIKPAINDYAMKNQVIGYNLAINQTLSQLQQYGYVTMTIGNQTLYLVPYNQNSSG